MAKSVPGKAAHTATAPLTTLSSQLPRHQAAIAPRTAPSTSRAMVAKKASVKVCLDPAKTSAWTSRPTGSLPHGNTDEGLNGGAAILPSILMIPWVS